MKTDNLTQLKRDRPRNQAPQGQGHMRVDIILSLGDQTPFWEHAISNVGGVHMGGSFRTDYKAPKVAGGKEREGKGRAGSSPMIHKFLHPFEKASIYACVKM